MSLKERTSNAGQLLKEVIKQKHLESNALSVIGQILSEIEKLVEDMTTKWVEQRTKPGSALESNNSSVLYEY